ncbi:MAG TPA: family 16 glycosylhydrolase, partial [Paludibacter sp.]
MKNSFSQLLSFAVLGGLLCVGCSAQNEPPLEEEVVTSTEVGSGETNGYTLVWQDLFNGTKLDETNNWVIEVNGDGGGNSELQYYRRENISVGVEPVSGANCLIIKAKKESYSGKTCTSGRLKTAGKMSFKHGKIEARIKLPKTANGLWPAFWMMGADYATVGWPKCGEMDILEMGNANGINRGTQDKYFSTWFHWGESWNGGSYPNWGKDYTSTTGIQDDFHLFTLIWDDAALKTYIDLDKNPAATPICEMAINGADVAGNAAHYFHKKFYAIFNLAIGGNFTQIWDINKITALNAANNYESYMYVDYINVYQQGVAGEEYSGPKLTATSKVIADKAFKMYPNPATDRLIIQATNAIARVTIFDLSGKEILNIRNSNSIDTSTLAKGNYVVKIEDENGKTES